METDRKSSLTVCVIGAGVCGLVATKICLENDLQVTCFDRSSKYGGLWRYRPDCEDGPVEPSVMKTTVLNTTKEASAFSDFPPPAHLPNFMRHDQYMDYIDSYVRHFRLEPHLRLEHEIVKCWPEWRDDGDEENSARHIRWMVRTRHVPTGDETLHKFDRLMVAVGHHNIPFAPAHEGQQQFRGEVLHSARLKDISANKKLAGKRVLVVGFGNSACDAANDIAAVADQCYLSCHRGNWVYGRFFRLNPPTRFQLAAHRRAPLGLLDRHVVSLIKQRVDHGLLGLEPTHQPSQLTPAINDLLPYRIITGAIVLKNSVKTFTETGAIFEGEEDEEYPIDVAVLATGYEAKIGFLDELGLGVKSARHNNEYDLFLNIFAPNLTLPGQAHAGQANTNGCCAGGQQPLVEPARRAPLEAVKSLAFVGLVQPNGSLTAVSEMQSRYACMIFKGERELPSMDQMLKSVEQMRKMRSRSIRSHSRDQLVGNYLAYMETVACLAGVSPNLSRLFFRDHTLWRRLMFGPNVPYQYRLEGPCSWPEARQTILAAPDRINAGINQGKNHILYKTREERSKGGRKCAAGQNKRLNQAAR